MEDIAMWNYYQPVHVIWGEGKVKDLGQVMKEAGYQRGFMIADRFLAESGMTDKLIGYSDNRIIGVSTDVEPNPSIQNVDDAAAKAKGVDADCIIAFGGGSSMDCAKSVAASLAGGQTGEELLSGVAINKALPVIAIPTTAGTGSEVTAGAVLSDKKRGIKSAIFSPLLFPAIALVDPELTYTVPPKVTASTGLDVLAHCFDALSSVKANPVTDALAMRAAGLAVRNLERAFDDGQDHEARAGMSQASTIAGLAFSQTGTTGSHACSYMLTSHYHVPHGEACAFTMDSWFVINAKFRPEMNEFAKELGFADAEAVAAWLNRLKKKFGMRMTLQDIGITEEDIPALAENDMKSGNMANDIAKVDLEDVSEIFRSKSQL
jgi:alcohol dehydrogenase class IV